MKVDDNEGIIFDEVGKFMGTGRRSPSRQYMIAFGSRTVENDKYGDHCLVLFHRENAIFRAKLKDRIHNACVDDAGNFCLQTFEWPRATNGETFWFFRSTGKQYASIFAPGYPSLIGLEQDGNRILFVAEEKMFVLNVSPTWTLASFALPRNFHPTHGYTDEERKLLFLSQRGSDYYRFSFSGDFLDERNWFRDFVQSADGLTLFFAVRNRYHAQKDWTPEQYREAADCIAIALERGIKDSFHLSRSDVLHFLEMLRREAGDVPAARQAAIQAEAELDGFRVVDILAGRLDQIIKDGDLSILRENLAKLEKAGAYPRLNSYPNYFGRLHKFKGMLFAALGDHANAIAAFKRALEINPRVGCKRQLNSLEISRKS